MCRSKVEQDVHLNVRVEQEGLKEFWRMPNPQDSVCQAPR
jgi:hypothetical protein